MRYVTLIGGKYVENLSKKKNGNRFWLRNFDFYDGEFKNKKELKAYFETDRYNPVGKRNTLFKHDSKKARRTKEKAQLYKVVHKNDLSIHTYDDSYENEHIKKLIWEYF